MLRTSIPGNCLGKAILKHRIAWVATLTCLLAGCLPLNGAADVFDNVPEVTSEGYLLVYTLPIEDQAGYATAGSVPYSADNSASVSGPFDRIAYYLELDSGSGLVWFVPDPQSWRR